MSDPRALSLVLFHALSARIRRYDELTPSQARSLVVDALELLPDYTVEKTTLPHLVRVSAADGSAFDLNIQDFADSLLLLHREYQRLMEKQESEA